MGSRYPVRPRQAPLAATPWTLVPIAHVEALQEAILGAGLEAAQLSRAPLTGSLGCAMQGRVILNSGYIGGRVALSGVLSENLVTLGLGVVLNPGSRQWLADVQTGNVAVYLPGDDHDAVYAPGSLYAAVTLSREDIESAAAAHDLVLDPFTLGGSGVHRHRVAPERLAALQSLCFQLHQRAHATGQEVGPVADILGRQLLRDLILHLAREPRTHVGPRDPRGTARIVARARAFIHDHIEEKLNIEAIAASASTSPRSLHRAFKTVLNETPYSYVLKQRLHGVRRALLSQHDRAITITMLANQWGVAELGRFAGWYHDLFGELPSETRSRAHSVNNAAVGTSEPQSRSLYEF